MSELGLLLKKARMEKGYTLDDVEEHTKIRKRYLEAIESGDFGHLPGNFYVRAFIKNYALCVGLDSKEVLSLYRNVLPGAGEDKLAQSRVRPKKVKTPGNGDRLGRWISTTLMILFIIFIIAIVYYFVYKGHNSHKGVLDPSNKITQQQASNASGNEADSAPSNQLPNQLSKKPSLPVKPAPPKSTKKPQPQVTMLKKNDPYITYEVSHAKTIDFHIDVSGKLGCWISVKQIGGKVLSPGEGIKNGGSWDTSSKLSLQVVLGLPNNAKISVDGVPVALDKTTNPRTLQFLLKK